MSKFFDTWKHNIKVNARENNYYAGHKKNIISKKIEFSVFWSLYIVDRNNN